MSRLILLFVIAVYLLICEILVLIGVSYIFPFLILGIAVGLYYGRFNNDIFHKSGKFNNEFEKVQTLWIHIVCGLIGSLSLYYLFIKVFILNIGSAEFGLGDFTLLLIGILGVVGLLPRTFWFLANSGKLFGTGNT